MKKLFSFAIACCIAVSAFATGHTVTIPTHTNATCFGICNGSATASVSGGVGPFSYAWSPPSGGTTATVTGLCAGSYTVTVTDNSDASTATATVTIVQPMQVVASIGGAMVACVGTCVPLNGFASGGTPAYTYNWTPATGLSATTTANPVSCPPASMSYTLVVTDMNGCVGTTSVNITVIPPIGVSTSVVDATCGNCNGSATPTITGGGSPPYTYNWSNGSTAFTATNLCMGTYTVTVTDATGCMGTALAMVNSVPSITAINTTVTNAACGNADGAVTINSVSGGLSPYTYSWSPGGQTTQNVTGLAAGVYNVTVTDSLGCQYSAPVVVNNAGGPTAVATTITNSACVGTTGQVDIGTVTGGVLPYTYSFNGGPFTATLSYSGLAVGTYALAVKDANGCIFSTLETIAFLNAPVISLDTLVNATCAGGAYGNIAVSLSGGTAPYNYSWSNGDTALSINSLIGGNYTITVTDAAGCSANHLYHIANASAIYASVASTPANCGTLGTATVTPVTGLAPYSFAWNTVPVQTTATATGLTGGSYSCLITDAGGCTTTVYAGVSINCYNIIKGNIYNDANSNCIKEVGETGIAGRQVVATPGYYYGFTDVNGNYTILTPNMSNTVTYGSMGVGSFLSPTCPVTGSLNVNFSTPGDTSLNNDFGLYANPSYVNLVLHPGWSTANPGFQKHYWICYYNGSPTPQNVTIRFVYDSLLQFSSCTMGGVHYPATHSIEWNYSAVAPATSWNWATKPEIYFNVPVTLTTSTLLHSYFEILPIVGDAYPSDNTLTTDEPVTSSRDPNSKAVMPTGDGPNGDIFVSDSTLLYTIHFQNNGNDTAHFVIVKDTLSSFLDPATIVPGAASHPYTFELSEQGIMTFTFNDIMLPDSTTDEPGSNGYFNYTIRQRANNPVGTVINNTAGIYFDYNLPVMTNTTINTIVDVATGIETTSTNDVVKVYPNPFSDNTTFVIQTSNMNETYSFEMTDVLGKRVSAMNNISEKQFSVSRNGLQNGIYFYKIYSANGVVGIGKVIIK